MAITAATVIGGFIASVTKDKGGTPAFFLARKLLEDCGKFSSSSNHPKTATSAVGQWQRLFISNGALAISAAIRLAKATPGFSCYSRTSRAHIKLAKGRQRCCLSKSPVPMLSGQNSFIGKAIADPISK